MNKTTSLYLDAIRVIAAFAVVLSHTKNFLLPTLPRQITNFSSEAVVVFFVLSGYLISYVSQKRETTLKDYAIARVSRIVPVALIALLATLILDTIGRSQGLQYYARFPTVEGVVGVVAFLKDFLFLNEIWFTHSVFGTSEPYWSLGFEVWYYTIFGAVIFFPGRKRLIITAALLLIAGPKIIACSLLWIIGVLTQRYGDSICGKMSRLAAIGTLAIIPVLYVALRKTLAINATPLYELHGLEVMVPSLTYFGGTAVCFAASILAVQRLGLGVKRVPAYLDAPIRWTAGATFTLYLLHQPLIVFLGTIANRGHVDVYGRTLLFAGCLLLVLLLAECAERRKRVASDVIKLLTAKVYALR